MTIESPLAHNRPPDDFSQQVKFNSNRENSSSPTAFFHDYARLTASNNTEITVKMSSQQLDNPQNLRPLFIIPDHSLAADWSAFQSTSPDSTFMYEDCGDRDTKGALLSPCTSESPGYRRDGFDQPCEEEEASVNLGNMSSVGLCDVSSLGLNNSDESMCLWGQMDGPPLQDYLSDLINSEDGSSIKDIGDALAACIKTEDPLRVGLKDCSGAQGPTLAQLNDRESVLDILASPSSGAGSRWIPQTAIVQPVTSEIWTSNYPSYTAKSTSTSSSRAPAVRPSSSATLTSSGLLPSSYLPQQSSNGTQPSRPANHTSASLQELLRGTTMMKKEQSENKSCGVTKKRVRTTSETDDDSNGSMERKWEEIRCYIDSNIKLEKASTVKADGKKTQDDETPTSTPVKRIKMEPVDSTDSAPKSVSTKYSSHIPEFKAAPAERKQEYTTIKEELDSDYDNSDDDFSDVDSDASYGSFVEDLLHGTQKKEKRYFWQYNTQSKGPKGKRLCKSMTEADPHSLADFEDPVFQPDVNDARYKHNGKARKGDGNDITPNPWKLFQIGNELQKLNKKINGIAMTEKPQRSKDGIKSKSRKEKNKYASRACRLKKKAQHEANKLKLFGLEQEHHQLMEVLKTIKGRIYNRIKHNEISAGETTFCAMLEEEVKQNLTVMIAGNTSDYVNTVLQKVAEGDKSGGIHRA